MAHFAKGEVTDKKVLRVTQGMGTLLWNVLLFVGDQLSEEQVAVIASNVQAMSRCLTGDHTMCKQWAEQQAEQQGEEEVKFFCKALDDNTGEVWCCTLITNCDACIQ